MSYNVNRDLVREYIEIRTIIDMHDKLNHLQILRIDEFIYLIDLLQFCTRSVYHYKNRWTPRLMELQSIVNKYRMGQS